MRAEVKSFYSDADYLADASASGPINFCFFIGPAGGLGEEMFQIYFCTPESLVTELRDEPIFIGRFFLFQQKFDLEAGVAYLTAKIESEEGETWDELATKISRYMMWEFELYDDKSGTWLSY